LLVLGYIYRSREQQCTIRMNSTTNSSVCFASGASASSERRLVCVYTARSGRACGRAFYQIRFGDVVRQGALIIDSAPHSSIDHYTSPRDSFHGPDQPARAIMSSPSPLYYDDRLLLGRLAKSKLATYC